MDDTAFGEELEASIPKFHDSQDSLVSNKQARWEHRIVGKLLANYSLERQSQELLRLAYDRTKQRRLTFEAFKMLNPSFPLWLGFNKKANLHQGKYVEIWRHPSRKRARSKSWVYQMFEDGEDQAPEEYQCSEANFGVVFEVMYAEGGPEMIIYRYNGTLKPPPDVTTIVQYHLPHVPQKIEACGLEMFLSRLPWTPE